MGDPNKINCANRNYWCDKLAKNCLVCDDYKKKQQ